MVRDLTKQILLWGLLLFIVSRFFLYLLAALFTLIGLSDIADLLSALLVALFAGFAGYMGLHLLSKNNQINKLVTPLIFGLGIVVTAQLFNAVLNLLMLGQLNIGYNLGLLRLVTGVIGGYIAAARTNSPFSNVSSSL